MMQGLVVTHGELARHLAATAVAVAGDHGVSLSTLSNEGKSVHALREEIAAWLEDRDGEVLIFVDALGSSCASAAQLASEGRRATWILAGVNLPMLMTFLTSASALSGDPLVEKCRDRGQNSVRRLGEAP